MPQNRILPTTFAMMLGSMVGAETLDPLSNHDQDSSSGIQNAPPVTVESDQVFTVDSISTEVKWKLMMTPAENHYANVEFHNELARAIETPKRVTFQTDIGPVVVHFSFGDGSVPDLFYVVPPPGYYAMPVEVSVEEGEIGIIEIHEGGTS